METRQSKKSVEPESAKLSSFEDSEPESNFSLSQSPLTGAQKKRESYAGVIPSTKSMSQPVDTLGLSVGTIAALNMKTKVNTPLTLQIESRVYKSIGKSDRVMMLELSDSQNLMVFHVSSKVPLSTVERRKLIPHNIITVNEIEVNEKDNTWHILSLSNIRESNKVIGAPKPFFVSSEVDKHIQQCDNALPSTSFGASTSDVDGKFVSIANITHMSYDISLRGKVVSRAESVRPTQTLYGLTQVFDFLIADDTGRIKVVVWGDLADDYSNLVKVGSGYVISDFQVKKVLKKSQNWNTSGHDCDISVTRFTTITPDDVASSLTVKQLAYTPISELLVLSDQQITSIEGVVTRVDNIQTRSIRGIDRRILKICVIDETMHLVEVTLWDDLARFTGTIGSSIALQYFKASRYQGFGITSFVGSKVLLSLNAKLESWWKIHGHKKKTIPLKSLFDKRACATAVTSFELMCLIREKVQKDLDHINGVYRLININNLRAYSKCSECNSTLQPTSLNDKTVACTHCKKVCTLLQNQFVATLIFGDATGHFSVGVYTNTLMDLYDLNGDCAPMNINKLSKALENLRFCYFHAHLKIDVQQNGRQRLQLTEMTPWSMSLMSLYVKSVVEREIKASKFRGRLYHHYWESDALYCVSPIQFSEITKSDRHSVLEKSPYELLTFAAILGSVRVRCGVTSYVFEVNENEIVFKDTLKRVNLDEEEDLGKLMEVVVQKKLNEDQQYSLLLLSACDLPEGFSDQYDVNRKLLLDYMNTMKQVYRNYEEDSSNDDEPSSYVNKSLSPRMSKMSFGDGPPTKKSKPL